LAIAIADRVAEILPIARQQWRKSAGAAMMAYFGSDKPSEDVKAAWRKTGIRQRRTMERCKIPTRRETGPRPCTPSIVMMQSDD
jgi:hypothetical protein